MQAFLLVGSTHNQTVFIESFLVEKTIPSYQVTRFPESFKIADARALKSKLAGKIHEDESRVIIIENPTLDSQNALLKTIEELPDRTYVLFLSQNKDSLLPTILSRVQLIEFEKTQIEPDASLVASFSKGYVNLEMILAAAECMSPTPTQEDLEVLIVSLRSALLTSVRNDKPYQALHCYLKNVTKNYSLSSTNNVNRRMIPEASL